MKKLISSLLVVSAMMASMTVKADNITPEQAKEAAARYLGYVIGADKLTAAEFSIVHQIDNLDLDVPAMYFLTSSCGWIIIGGTTVNDPVIAYSTEANLDMENLPDNMWWWLNSYAADIMEVQLMDAENDYPDCAEWQTIVNRKFGPKAQQVQLLNAKWDQGETNPTKAKKSYNRFCPVKTSNGKVSVTGCVATALSQLIYYYKYPVSPQKVAKTWFEGKLLKVDLDTVFYDYSMMTNMITSSTDTMKINEIAKLCYHVGLSVQMEYDPSGSASNSYYVKLGIPKNFKYLNPVQVNRGGDDDTSFVNTVRRELIKKNVVYMSGSSSIGSGADAAGHAWLVTGYEVDNETYMYFNWGWGGSGNAWYNFRTNNMYISSMGYNFNVGQSIMRGLTPPADSNIHAGGDTTAITEVEDNTVLGTAYPNPAALSVCLPYIADRAGELNVYSIDGKQVASYRVQAGSGHVEMNVSGMPAGIYIYRLNSQNGKFMVR